MSKSEAASNEARSPESAVSTVVTIAVVATAYFIAARIGLQLDAVSGFATLVWPASGIALAAILLGGPRLWPAIAIGAAAANLMNGASLPVATGIALGNTAEALIGAHLIRRVSGFSESLDRVRSALALIVLAGMISTVVAATIGVTTLLVAGLVSTARFLETWRAWWIGDAIGDVMVAPLILVWAAWRPRWPRARRLGESIALGITLFLVSVLVFDYIGPSPTLARGRQFMLFPPLLWAALRFNVRGAVTSTAFVSLIAIVFTTLQRGPFAQAELHNSLLSLQVFVGILAATFLLLGASLSEKRRVARELRDARETAEAANRAKSSFLAVVSHELRTPLNAITGYVDLLSLELEGPLNEKQHAILGRIAQSQRHLLSLIDDVLGFAQVEAGRLSFSLQSVRVQSAIDAIEPIVAPQMMRRGLTLRVDECDPGLLVRADPDRLRQILLNLVANSMKFTLPGGLVRIRAEGEGGRVRITVSDSGIGIPTSQINKVFDPFFQVHQGGTRQYPGLGLGLSIVRDVVLAMEGHVAIESEPQKGTTVTVWLPILAATFASEQSLARAAELPDSLMGQTSPSA
jgi:signal transduction histidine kinase